jgi:hypothetical protein
MLPCTSKKCVQYVLKIYPKEVQTRTNGEEQWLIEMGVGVKRVEDGVGEGGESYPDKVRRVRNVKDRLPIHRPH